MAGWLSERTLDIEHLAREPYPLRSICKAYTNVDRICRIECVRGARGSTSLRPLVIAIDHSSTWVSDEASMRGASHGQVLAKGVL
jgi:hypothetical protein